MREGGWGDGRRPPGNRLIRRIVSDKRITRQLSFVRHHSTIKACLLRHVSVSSFEAFQKSSFPSWSWLSLPYTLQMFTLFLAALLGFSSAMPLDLADCPFPNNSDTKLFTYGCDGSKPSHIGSISSFQNCPSRSITLMWRTTTARSTTRLTLSSPSSSLFTPTIPAKWWVFSFS